MSYLTTVKKTSQVHTFHIPVMGTGFTIDTPIKVAHFGIDSVVSIIDHRLVEQMREYYHNYYNIPFEDINKNDNDFRAKTITLYLNLINKIVNDNFNKLIDSKSIDDKNVKKYFELLPENSDLRKLYLKVKQKEDVNKIEFWNFAKKLLVKGNIDINIMTNADNENYDENKNVLPNIYNDAHAALRGFALSELSSSVVLSAGLNPKLYSYMSEFSDFIVNENGKSKKKIILKVSDFRSALIQGKFLAKKGLWVSEYRIESGINCGGHAFPTDGLLLGPILQEFKDKRTQLLDEIFEIFKNTMLSRFSVLVAEKPSLSVSAQGGVGTSDEHEFLINHYNLKTVGWGSPFLLVPEVVSIDNKTVEILSNAKQSDYYLSNASPFGVPFNTVKGTIIQNIIDERISKNKPGSPCLKKHLSFNKEFTNKAICTASSEYQRKKIINIKENETDVEKMNYEIDKVLEKTCLCVGLANSTLSSKNINLPKTEKGIAVCPGPNLANFNKISTLKEIVDHIYGRIDLIVNKSRMTLFSSEALMYLNYYTKLYTEKCKKFNDISNEFFIKVRNNLLEGILYYKNQIKDKKFDNFVLLKQFIHELNIIENSLKVWKIE